MSTWVMGARPRTLPAAVVPVAVGAAVCAHEAGAVWWRVVPALLVSLLLQVGVNYANDYSDGVRGTDEVRVGPQRLVGGGLASPKSVKSAAFTSFGLAAIAGAVLAFATTPWLFAVGVAALLAGWFYTGGAHPYGYLGLGEVFVFVFFGLVATMGTTYVVIERLPASSWWMGVATGSLACALLVTNNLRDIPTDREVGKRTLAVRLGDRRARAMYVALLVVSLVASWACVVDAKFVVLTVVAIPFMVVPVRTVIRGATGRELIAVLGATSRVQLIFGVSAVIGLILSR